jgi:acetoin reductase-like protein
MDNPLRLDGSVALVTGAASGIGRAIALRFANEGADLALADLNQDGARAVAGEIEKLGRRARAYRLDVSKPEESRALVDRVVADLGHLDIRVNSAGVAHVHKLFELTEQDWDLTFAVNTRGLFFLTQAAGRVMKEQQRGKIINLASIAARLNGPELIDYSASKAAVVSITQSTAKALAPFKVTVNALAPGIVDTPMWRQLDKEWGEINGWEPGEAWRRRLATIALGRSEVPEDVAGAAAFLASKDADYITGQTLHVEGGIVMV